MEYKLKYPKIKNINESTKIPNYIIIKTDSGLEGQLSYNDALKYIEECKEKKIDRFIYTIKNEDLNLFVSDIEKMFEPCTGLRYAIKDKLLRNPYKTATYVLTITGGVLVFINSCEHKESSEKDDLIEALEGKLEAEAKRADCPSNAGKVLRKRQEELKYTDRA